MQLNRSFSLINQSETNMSYVISNTTNNELTLAIFGYNFQFSPLYMYSCITTVLYHIP